MAFSRCPDAHSLELVACDGMWPMLIRRANPQLPNPPRGKLPNGAVHHDSGPIWSPVTVKYGESATQKMWRNYGAMRLNPDKTGMGRQQTTWIIFSPSDSALHSVAKWKAMMTRVINDASSPRTSHRTNKKHRPSFPKRQTLPVQWLTINNIMQLL